MRKMKKKRGRARLVTYFIPVSPAAALSVSSALSFLGLHLQAQDTSWRTCFGLLSSQSEAAEKDKSKPSTTDSGSPTLLGGTSTYEQKLPTRWPLEKSEIVWATYTLPNGRGVLGDFYGIIPGLPAHGLNQPTAATKKKVRWIRPLQHPHGPESEQQDPDVKVDPDATNYKNYLCGDAIWRQQPNVVDVESDLPEIPLSSVKTVLPHAKTRVKLKGEESRSGDYKPFQFRDPKPAHKDRGSCFEVGDPVWAKVTWTGPIGKGPSGEVINKKLILGYFPAYISLIEDKDEHDNYLPFPSQKVRVGWYRPPADQQQKKELAWVQGVLPEFGSWDDWMCLYSYAHGESFGTTPFDIEGKTDAVPWSDLRWPSEHRPKSREQWRETVAFVENREEYRMGLAKYFDGLKDLSPADAREKYGVQKIGTGHELKPADKVWPPRKTLVKGQCTDIPDQVY
ncbi:unnamed protein product [Amoebophrya sp. A120]|nr:unnamed protein product [Amoebophrya sp. A120]|eukprot:GSA120T00013734001.1